MNRIILAALLTAATPLFAETPAAAPKPATPAPAPAEKAPAPATHAISVKVTGIKNDKGNLRLAIHNSETTFPKQWDKAMKVVTVTIPAGKTEVTIPVDNLKPGSYALLVHHDEDANGEIKRYWVGMPAEGMANSGTKPVMGAPSWKKSAFTVPETSEVTLKLSYL